VKNLFLSIVVVLCGVSLVAFQKYRNDDLQTRMVSIATIFKQRKLKNLLSQLTKRQSTPFEKYPDLNKQQSMYLTYMEREITIWYNKEGLIALADLLFQSEGIRR
jgi:hypothetical protein